MNHSTGTSAESIEYRLRRSERWFLSFFSSLVASAFSFYHLIIYAMSACHEKKEETMKRLIHSALKVNNILRKCGAVAQTLIFSGFTGVFLPLTFRIFSF